MPLWRHAILTQCAILMLCNSDAICRPMTSNTGLEGVSLDDAVLTNAYLTRTIADAKCGRRAALRA